MTKSQARRAIFQLEDFFNEHPLAWAWVAGLAAASGENGRRAWEEMQDNWPDSLSGSIEGDRF